MTEQTTSTRTRTAEQWETISVTALPPGWANAYELETEDGATLHVPCPALLLQELRSVTHCTDTLDATGNVVHAQTKEEALEPPYRTRVEAGDASEGWVQIASDAGNYLGTMFLPHLFLDNA